MIENYEKIKTSWLMLKIYIFRNFCIFAIFFIYSFEKYIENSR
jgi:hypothetical protein